MGNLTSTDAAVGAPVTATWGIEVGNSGAQSGGKTSGSTVTLTTAAQDYASPISTTVVLGRTRRVKVTVQSRYATGTATAGRVTLTSAYNSGASVSVGSNVNLGALCSIPVSSTGTAGSSTGTQVGDVLLPAGTYTFYAVVNRANGGAASDSCAGWYLLVEDIGAN